MKSRLSYFLISGIIISIFIGSFIWRNKHVNELPQFNEKSFSSPISSNYIPKNAEIVFHWKINPTELPNYIDNFQEKVKKNTANQKIKFIRDSAFKLISLDFSKDISKWAGEYGSFAIFETNNQLLKDWLMVMEIRKDINIDEELISILEPIFIGEDIDSSKKLNSSKSKLLTKEITSNKSIYFSIEEEHILISSSPKIIDSSRKQLENNILSTKEKYYSRKLKNEVRDGILLIEMSPKNVFKLIGQEEDILELNQAEKLIAVMNIDKNELIVEGILSYKTKGRRPIDDLGYDLIDMEKEYNEFDNLILIDNPKQYFESNSSYPFTKLIASVIQNSITEDYSNLLKLILKSTKGNLTWLKNKEWLAVTRKVDLEKEVISDILKKEKFSNSKVEFKTKNLEVWSKITTNNNQDEIKENIEAIIEENEDVYIWSQNLSSISSFNNKQYLANIAGERYEKKENIDFDDIIRIHLGKEKSEVFINNFYPYILLRTMLGNKLNFPEGINMSMSIPTINYPDFIKFKINLI